MSAFICSDREFATVALHMFKDSPLNAQEFANHLKRENVKSVNHRYDEKNQYRKVNMAKGAPAGSFAPSDILKLLHCIDYQSCEHEDYVSYPLSLMCELLVSQRANAEHSNLWAI